MSYRQLTDEEIIRLGQEVENRRRWEHARDFALALYGPRAHQMTISVQSEYNDNGYDEEVSILVTDRAGEPLRYDFTLPWWARFTVSEQLIAHYLEASQEDQSGNIEAIRGWRDDGGEEIYKALKQRLADAFGIEGIEHWQPFDPITYTFVVGEPPAMSHAAVFVPA